MIEEQASHLRKKDSVPLLSADYAQSFVYKNGQQVQLAKHTVGRRPARYDFSNEPQPRRRVRPALQDYVPFPWYIKKPMMTPLTYHIITADRTSMTGASTKMKIRPVHSEASRPSQASAFRGAAHDQNKECHDLTGRASDSLTTGIATTYK